MSGDREKFMAAGLDGHVGKPVELEALQRALRTVTAAIDRKR